MSTPIIVLSDSDSENDSDSSSGSGSDDRVRRRVEKVKKAGEITISDSPTFTPKERAAVVVATEEKLASLVRVAKETDSKRGWGGAVHAAPKLHPWHARVISTARRLRGDAEVTAQAGHPYRNGALHASDLRTLAQGKWLNDEVINCYLELVADSCGAVARCLAMTTFFYTALTEHGYDYKRVQKWTRGPDGTSTLSSYEYVLIPVHRVCHWTLAVADVRKRSITYYDSLGRNEGGKQVCEHLSHWLLDEEDEGRGGGERSEGEGEGEEEKEKKEENPWKIVFPRGIPLQKNGSDCGVFVCKYAECVAFGVPFNFTQKDMPRIRDAMTYELVAKALLIPLQK